MPPQAVRWPLRTRAFNCPLGIIMPPQAVLLASSYEGFQLSVGYYNASAGCSAGLFVRGLLIVRSFNKELSYRYSLFSKEKEIRF